MMYTLDFNNLYVNLGVCFFFSTEKWSIKYGSYCIVATAQMKFASEARPSQYIGPFGNIEPTCMPLSGHLNRSMNEGSRAMTFFLKIDTVTLTLAYHNYWSNPETDL